MRRRTWDFAHPASVSPVNIVMTVCLAAADPCSCALFEPISAAFMTGHMQTGGVRSSLLLQMHSLILFWPVLCVHVWQSNAGNQGASRTSSIQASYFFF